MVRTTRKQFFKWHRRFLISVAKAKMQEKALACMKTILSDRGMTSTNTDVMVYLSQPTFHYISFFTGMRLFDGYQKSQGTFQELSKKVTQKVLP